MQTSDFAGFWLCFACRLRLADFADLASQTRCATQPSVRSADFASQTLVAWQTRGLRTSLRGLRLADVGGLADFGLRFAAFDSLRSVWTSQVLGFASLCRHAPQTSPSLLRRLRCATQPSVRSADFASQTLVAWQTRCLRTSLRRLRFADVGGLADFGLRFAGFVSLRSVRTSHAFGFASLCRLRSAGFAVLASQTSLRYAAFGPLRRLRFADFGGLADSLPSDFASRASPRRRWWLGRLWASLCSS
jgi:hypothetical protein